MSQATEEVNHADIDRCDSEIRDLKGRDARSSSAIDAIDRTEARCSWTARGSGAPRPRVISSLILARCYPTMGLG